MESISKLLKFVIDNYEKKEYGAAENAVDELLKAYPDFHRGNFLKAVILEETGRVAMTEPYYAKSGNRYTLWMRLAMQLHDIDPQRAMVYYERVMKTDPENNLMWFNLGSLYEKAGRREDAARCYKKISPAKEVASKIFIPLGFAIFLASAGVVLSSRGEKGMTILVFASAVFCLFWLRRDLGRTMSMIRKKYSA